MCSLTCRGGLSALPVIAHDARSIVVVAYPVRVLAYGLLSTHTVPSPRLRSPDPPCRGSSSATLRTLDPLGPPGHHDPQRTERILKQLAALPRGIELVRHQQSSEADGAAA